MAKDLELNHKKLSHNIINRILKANGLEARKKKKKPNLSDKNREDRYVFSVRHKGWNVNQWKHVFFSDECKVYSNHLGIHFIRKKDEESWWEDESFILA